MTASTAEPAASDGVRIVLKGRITAYTAAPIWRSALETLASNPDRPIIIDAAQVKYADNVGIALLLDLTHRDRPATARVEILDLAPNLAVLMRTFDPKDFAAPARRPAHPRAFEQLGRATLQEISYITQMADFVGECWTELRQAFTRGGRINWGDVLDIASEAGANGVPVVLLIGFLMGVIIAFQSGLVARQFGAVIFVVNGVGFALLRELGPLLTAIVFAGRTGAAFAAQIGTQKVNEEVNAITTFGLSPVPLLSVLADLVGLFGAALVMLKFDISFLQFYNQLLHAVTAWDFGLGIVKAAVFGLTIAMVGCQRGLTTGAGATSVGLSTTRAVVTSIVLIIVIDGIFSIFTV
jgi:phospholipid/cholesterol/gamma-HCH transport system permease protein